MQKTIYRVLIALLVLTTNILAEEETDVLGINKKKKEEYTNYESLNHEVKLKKFRAGNHDESGTNIYYFKIKLQALIDSPEKKISS